MSNPNPPSPFLPGDPRINRKGRPKSGESLTETLRAMLDQPFDDGGPDQRTLRERLAETLAERALDKYGKRNEAYLKYFYDRMDGSPRQTVDISGAIGTSGAGPMDPSDRKRAYEELVERADERKRKEQEAAIATDESPLVPIDEPSVKED